MRNRRVVREGKDVDPGRRHRDPCGIGLFGIERPKDHLRTLVNSLLCHHRGRVGIAAGTVDLQLYRHARKVRHRQPRGILQILAEKLVLRLTRS